jgi:dienelactone hydrolase
MHQNKLYTPRLTRGFRYICLAAFAVAGCTGDEPPPSDADGKLLPEPTGSSAAGTRIEVLVDPDRGEDFTQDNLDDLRELRVTYFYPTDSTAAADAPYIDPTIAGWLETQHPAFTKAFLASVPPVAIGGAPVAAKSGGNPVLIFSPGLGVPAALYTATLVDLASHGFVVVAVDHPYVSGAVLRSDGSLADFVPPTDFEEQQAFDAQAFPTVVADLRFVAGQLAAMSERGGALEGAIDLSRMGALGHSFGGAAAIATCRADTRLAACANLDGSMRGDVTDAPVASPILIMATSGVLERDPTIASFWKGLEGPGALVEVTGTGHLDYSDVGLLMEELGHPGGRGALDLGTIDAERAASIMRDLTRSFFGAPLGLEAPSLDATAKLYPEVALTPH